MTQRPKSQPGSLERCAARAINFLAEKVTPNMIYVSPAAMAVFDKLATDTPGIAVAAQYIVGRVRAAGGTSVSVEFEGFTSEGRFCGNWLLKVEKML